MSSLASATRLALACALCAAGAVAGAPGGKEDTPVAPDAIVNPRVATDGWVDASSIESIMEGATRGARTDEEKVLALFHWYRRTLYHHRMAAPDSIRRNVLMAVNSFGFNLCGSQTAVFVTLLHKLGYRTRVMVGKGPGDFGGHTFWEVFYDGGWHCFDTMTSFYVYTRGEGRHVASVEELRADPTLVTRAVEEKCAPPAFLYCTFHQEMKGADKAGLAGTMGEADLTWSTLLFTAGTLVDFWELAPAEVRTIDDGGTYNGRYTPGVMDFVLKPGEELVRPWDNQGKWIKPYSHPDFGPHHTCGAADERDPVNFKYFEPYLRENYGHAKKCYRWYGNGWLEWRPDFSGADGGAAKFCRLEGLAPAAGGRLAVQAEAGAGAGALTIPVKCPYAGLEVELDLDLAQDGAESSTRVLLVEGKQSREVWRKDGAARGVEKIVIPHDGAALYEYELRIESRRAAGGSAAFAPKRLRTVFMENIFSLPSLVPGRNVVTVLAAAPAKLAAGSRLVVQYDWAEGEGWKTDRSITKEFAELPASFEVEVAGPKMPRMKQVVMRLVAGDARTQGR